MMNGRPEACRPFIIPKVNAEATVFIYFEATAHLVFEGRIELPEAATDVGATPLLRLRAVFEDGDDAEGAKDGNRIGDDIIQ